MRKVNMGLIYFFGSLGGLLFGYDTGVISGAILFIQGELGLAPWGQGVVVSSVLLGAVLASCFIGPLSDRFGRKRLLMCASIIFLIGAITSGLATGFATLTLARVILGMGVGVASSLVPTYLSELSPANRRGSLTGLFQLMVMTGILLAYISNYALAGVLHGWRWMLGLAAVPSAILLIGAFVLPESPRFLTKAGKSTSAYQVLVSMYRGDEAEASRQLSDIKRQAAQKDGGLKELFSPLVRPALIGALGLAVFQQIMGCNTVLYYAPTIFTNVGFGVSTALIAHIGIGIFNVMVTAIGIKIIDRVDRKTMLIGGAIGMAGSLFIMSCAMFFAENSMLGAWVCAIALTIYIAFFSGTWGPVMWTMIGEMFPLQIRGLGNSVGSTINWLANSVVSLTFPALLAFAGTEWLFIGYGLMCLLAIWFVRTWVFETRGRSLEDIETALRERAQGHATATVATTR